MLREEKIVFSLAFFRYNPTLCVGFFRNFICYAKLQEGHNRTTKRHNITTKTA